MREYTNRESLPINAKRLAWNWKQNVNILVLFTETIAFKQPMRRRRKESPITSIFIRHSKRKKYTGYDQIIGKKKQSRTYLRVVQGVSDTVRERKRITDNGFPESRKLGNPGANKILLTCSYTNLVPRAFSLAPALKPGKRPWERGCSYTRRSVWRIRREWLS